MNDPKGSETRDPKKRAAQMERGENEEPGDDIPGAAVVDLMLALKAALSPSRPRDTPEGR